MICRRIQRIARHAENAPDVRVALRVPAEIHEQIRRRAKEERLSVNQAIVKAMERFAGSANTAARQEIRDLIDICRAIGSELSPQFKQALIERVKSVYGFDLSADYLGIASIVRQGGAERFLTDSH